MAPEVGAGGARQGGVFEDEVYAGGDGFVEDGDAVGGEEEDALEEFELAEEDWWVGLLVSDVDARLWFLEGSGRVDKIRERCAHLLPWSSARIDLRRCFCALRGRRRYMVSESAFLLEL